MTLDPRLYEEMSQLLGALCEWRIDAAGARRLQELVVENPAARQFYIQYMHVHAGLVRLTAIEPEAELLGRLEALLPKSSSSHPETRSAKTSRLPTLPGANPGLRETLPIESLVRLALARATWAAIAAAAAVVIVLALPGWWRDWQLTERRPGEAPPVATPAFVATLARAPGCRWDSSQLPTEVGARLLPGRLRLAEGQALVEFDSGARVLVQGPAVLDLQSAMAAQLLSGQVTVEAPARARGFTIETLAAKVIDLGTAFGLSVEPSGANELHVLEGIVELEPCADRKSLGKEQLLAGQARRLDARSNSSWVEIPLQAARFVREGLATQPAAGPRQLADDFDGEALDPDKWRIVTEGIAPGGARVEQTGGRVELANRGYLVTAEEFDPRAVGPLSIRGRWTFNSTKEYLQILTRCSAEPTGDHGETASGIEFNVDVGSDKVGISERLDGRTTPVGGGDFHVRKGDVVEFEIFDDGLHLRFTVNKVGVDGAGVTIAGTSGLDFARDYVVFHNRERLPASRTLRTFFPEAPPYQEMVSYLDDVTIEVGGKADSAAVKPTK